MRRYFWGLFLVGLLLACDSHAGEPEKPTAKRPAVLFLGVIPRQMHTWKDWLAAGFEIDARAISDIKDATALDSFNTVVVNFLPYWDVSGKPKPELLKLEKILAKYLKNGGGVVVFCGGGQWSGMAPSVSHFLKPYGAEIKEEQITDPKHVVKKLSSQVTVCYTTKIADQPMTKGIQRIGYIGTASRADCIKTTQPLVLLEKDKWQVVLRGEKTAYSAEGLKPGATAELKKTPATYDSFPLMAAWRKVGNGRLFVFPQNVAFTVASPEVFENVLWQKKITPGISLQNRQLIMQTIRWAGAPSLQQGTLGGYITDRSIPHDRSAILNYKGVTAIDWSTVKLPRKFSSLRGLVGLQSTYSGGKNSITQMCQAGRAAGLSFLAFTESLENINAEKWAKIKAECLKNSDRKFLALPGILGRDLVGNLWFYLGYVAFPKYPSISKDGKKIANTYQFWRKAFKRRLGGFVDPLSNPNPWYEMKQCSGMSVYTYKLGTLTETAVKEYLLSCSKMENYIPFSFTLIKDQEGIRKATAGMVNVFSGGTASDLKQYAEGTGKFKTGLYWANPAPLYLSKGPVLTYNGGRNLGNFATDEERQNIFRYAFKIDNLNVGDRIVLFDGAKRLREWRATETSFATEHTWAHQQLRQFIITVIRADKVVLVSSPVTLHYGPRFMQCGDRQNTLPYNYAPDHNGNYYVSGIPIGCHYRSWTPHTLVYGNFKSWLTGAVGIEAQPPMYISFDTSPQIPLVGTDKVAGHSLASYQYPKLSCPGIIIVDEVTDRMYPNGGAHLSDCKPPKKTAPLLPFRFNQRRYGLYGTLAQVNAQLIESKITLLKDVTLKGWTRVSKLTFPAGPNSEKSAELFTDGGITRYPLKKLPRLRRTNHLQSGDYIGMYPKGLPRGGAQYAVSDNLWLNLNADSNTKQFNGFIFLKLPKTLKKGTKIKYSMLYSTGGSVPNYPYSEYQEVVNFLGLANNKFPAISEIRGGKLLSSPVLATIAVERDDVLYLKTSVIDKSPLALPLRVRGYNPQWQVAYMLDGSKKWRYCGQLDRDFYFHLYTNVRPHRLVMGHPVIADREDIVIALDDPLGKQSQFEIYNPGSAPVTVKLQGREPFLPEQTLSVELKPFASQRVKFCIHEQK